MPRIQATASARVLPTNGERQAGFKGVLVPLVIFKPMKSGRFLYLFANLTLELPCKCFASLRNNLLRVYDMEVNVRSQKKARTQPYYLDWELVHHEQDQIV
jgi:hypothetical protein